jgi:predicted N-acetyltransferase YhbS
MAVHYLSERRELMPTVARWLFDQFGHLNPGASIERSERRMSARLHTEGCPVSFVSIDGEAVTGTVSLVESDLDERPQLFPWLAGLYVDPSYRLRGIGEELVNAVVHHARKCGYSRLYLFTPDRQSYFARLGWMAIERLMHHGVEITVMDRRL